MPSFDQVSDQPKKGKIIKSAFDSESFESDGTIHVDGLVGSATISPSGRDIALASPDGLAIIDLDAPYNPPRRLQSHGLPWLVVDVQWSPFAVRDYWVVSTANHRALVWNLNLREDSNTGAIEHSLQGHSRAITDINFSAHHPDLLSTCSVDGYVHCWDLRRPRQPVLTFCDWFAGATQVKYNRRDPHILASSHDRWLHIWDERRSSEPVKSISAHASKIYGVDWNRFKTSGIVTCSLDKSIKFWDYKSDMGEPEHVIRTDYPVWRARHTPFGWGLLAMPQNEPGDLHLYDRRWEQGSPCEAKQPAVAVFQGHSRHKAKEFLWRSRGGISEDLTDHREYQLVSWGTDNELRLQCINADILSSVGYTKGSKAPPGVSLTRKGAAYKTFRNVDDNAHRDRKTGKMSDPRPGSGGHTYRQSAITLGMRSSTTHNRQQVRSAWRGPSMKAKVPVSKGDDQTKAQLGWLKGITMTKRKSIGGDLKGSSSKRSAILSHGYPDDEWGDPDTVQEELLRVNTQLPKVKWESIDIENLTLSASLNGPWGVDGESIFIKVQIDIPTEYPTSKAPRFYIEKTSFMPEDTHKKIDEEIRILADRFLEHRQNCLEVAFTYLLGEADLESSTSIFQETRDIDDDLDGLADESSSDEDEEIPAGGSASMSQELVPAGETETALAAPSRTIVPPPPRTCGARFSHDGRLVSFFPTKDDKGKMLFSTSAEMYKDRLKGEPYFSGFGRLAQEVQPKPKDNGEEVSANGNASESSGSDESSSSSSDSEGTSIHKLGLWYRPRRQLRQTWSEDRSVRSSGGGTGTGAGTGTGTGTSRRRIVPRHRNVVTIHDMGADLPSKKELAREYIIFGDGADVCDHNAEVAEKYQYADLGTIWRYLALLLRRGIPLEILSHTNRRNSILVIARDAVAKSHEEHHETGNILPLQNGLSGRVKWGEHPLASGVIHDLFEHFEKLADIQMLAMLSCIFSESSADDSVAYVESQLPQPETPLPLKAPSFSLDYYPTDAWAWELYGKGVPNSTVTTPRTSHTPLLYSGSQISEDVLWSGDPASNSYSCGETPPTKVGGVLAEVDPSTGLSKSPNSRHVPRSSTGIAATFTRSIAGMSSNSPPTSKKKPSPTFFNSIAPTMGTVTWGGFSTAIDDNAGSRNSISDDEFLREESLPLVPVSVSVYIEDQTLFDDDGWLNTSFLEPGRARTYAHYRYAYAEMLHVWDQPLARLEIMKFNVLKDEAPSKQQEGSFHSSFTIQEGTQSPAHPQSGSDPLVMGKKDQLLALVAAGRGLDVTGICRVHETQLEPARYLSSEGDLGGAVGTCDRCHRIQRQLRCVYCQEPVIGLFPPCLSCGCASHESCLAEWHAAGEMLCPAGDECNCVQQALDGQVESWAALQGAMLKGPKSVTVLPPVAVEESDDDGEIIQIPSRRSVDGQRRSLGVPQLPTTLTSRLRKSAEDWSRASSRRRSERRGG